MSDKSHFDTQRLNAGYNPADHLYAVSPPIYATAAYDFRDVANAKGLFNFSEAGFLYTRVGNPTVAVLEERVKTLDGGESAIALGSGMAAISYTLMNLAENGGHILASPYLYGGSTDSFGKMYSRFGITIDLAKNILNPAKLAEEIKPNTKAIYVESISNPGTVLLDIDEIAKVAHKHGIPLVVDNTVATPYLYRPIEHGADIVVYSATKGLNGHGNVIAGVIVESGKFEYDQKKFPQFYDKYYTLRNAEETPRSYTEVFGNQAFTARIRLDYLNYFGAPLSPFDAYHVIIGIETLSERLTKQSQNALKLAKFLESNPQVEWVRYPGLESSPDYNRYKSDYKNGAGGLLSFGYKGTAAQREAFLNAVKVFHYHVNIGDSRSLIVNSPQTTHGELDANEQKRADIPANLIRISAGLEDSIDLIADLKQAFKVSEKA
ncbi:O-acetylhomoserine aminocarboxypropyltransferase [Clostridia bacterium]|nr:O-acetylhomoserine aminocarboxypropyltransferase [Clostridia bacterium]